MNNNKYHDNFPLTLAEEGTYLQVNGCDIVSVDISPEDKTAHVIVWASTHPDSVMAWSGTIDLSYVPSEEDDD